MADSTQFAPFSDQGYLQKWATETCSIYRIGIIRIGTMQLILGILCIIISGGLTWVTAYDPWAVLAMGAATLYLTAGLVCIGRARHGSKDMLSPTSGFCLLAVAASTFLSALSGYNIYGVVDKGKHIFPGYRLDDDSPLIITNAFLLLLSVLEFIAAVWGASLTVGIICICCHMKRDRVFTIPYDDTERELVGAEPGPRGPDIISRTTPPRLQLDLDMANVETDGEEEINR